MTREFPPGPFTALLVVVGTLVVAAAVVGPLVGFAAAGAEEEPNDARDAAQEVPVGEEVTGEITEGDEDWFAFTVEEGETINVSAAAPESDRSAEFNLITPDGDNVGGSRLNGGRDFFGTTAETGGTYYINTLGVSPSRGGGPYSFTVETYRTDGFEPDEDRANATDVSVGEAVNGEVSVGDEDWFAFTVEEGETINVSAAAMGDDLATEFNLVTPDGNGVAGTRLEDGRDFFGTTAETGGTYYINTLGVSPSRGGGPYSFTVETYRTDGFEPNDDRGNASRLYANPFPSDTATISVGDEEWFVFEADQGEDIEFEVTTTGDRGSEFDIEDNDGNDVGGTRLQDESGSVTATAETSGPHYLRARGVSPDSGGDEYGFTVDVSGRTLGLANDRFERPNPPTGNQDRANATTVLPGRYAELAIVDSDRDVFAIELTADDRLRPASSFSHSENDLALAVTDGSGTTLGSADSASDGEELTVTAPEAGTYYVAVSGAEGAAARYDLAVDVTRRANVTVGQDGELAVGEDGTLSVGVTNPGETAVDGVEVAANGTEALDVEPERREIGQLAAGETRTVEFTVRGNASGEGTISISVATETNGTVRVSSVSGLGTAFEQTPVSTEEPPDVATPTAEGESTDASQDGTAADGTATGTETSGDGAGFGAGSLLVTVASLVYLLGRRVDGARE